MTASRLELLVPMWQTAVLFASGDRHSGLGIKLPWASSDGRREDERENSKGGWLFDSYPPL